MRTSNCRDLSVRFPNQKPLSIKFLKKKDGVILLADPSPKWKTLSSVWKKTWEICSARLPPTIQSSFTNFLNFVDFCSKKFTRWKIKYKLWKHSIGAISPLWVTKVGMQTLLYFPSNKFKNLRPNFSKLAQYTTLDKNRSSRKITISRPKIIVKQGIRDRRVRIRREVGLACKMGKQFWDSHKEWEIRIFRVLRIRIEAMKVFWRPSQVESPPALVQLPNLQNRNRSFLILANNNTKNSQWFFLKPRIRL